MQTEERDKPLKGMRILVADDELLIAITLEQTFREAGADVIRASTVQSALSGAEQTPLSAAVLDVRMGTATTETVAEVLVRRRIPFLFYSGQPLPDAMREKFPDATVLVKPVRQSAFLDELLKEMRR